MTDQEMIDAILVAVQDDAKMVLLIRYVFTQTITTRSTMQLQMMMNVLGLPLTPP